MKRGLVSLFAGGGGLDLGLESAGFHTLVATEKEEHCCQTLIANRELAQLGAGDRRKFLEDLFAEQRCYLKSAKSEIQSEIERICQQPSGFSPLIHAKVLQGDIREISSQTLLDAARLKPGELFLLAGGPPCQPFSRAGKRETVEVADGKLFLEFVRTVREIRPRWFVFENVKGLLFAKTEVIGQQCLKCNHGWLPPFESRYSPDLLPVCCPKCGSKNIGNESRAARGGSLDIILNEFESIGYKCRWNVLNAVDFGAPQFRERLFIVGSRDGETFDFPVPSHGEVAGQAPQQLDLFESEAIQTVPWNSMYRTLWSSGHPKFGKLDTTKAVLWVKNVVRPHAEPVTWNVDRPSPTVGAHQAAKFALAPHGVPEEQLARQQWHTLGKRQGDTPPVDVVHAYLSDTELLKLQTFPDNWYLHGTRMERAFQIGNAVPLVLGAAVGRAVIRASGVSLTEDFENKRLILA